MGGSVFAQVAPYDNGAIPGIGGRLGRRYVILASPIRMGAIFRAGPRVTYVLSHPNVAETKQAAVQVLPFGGGESDGMHRR
jgi:hypothetical protein